MKNVSDVFSPIFVHQTSTLKKIVIRSKGRDCMYPMANTAAAIAVTKKEASELPGLLLSHMYSIAVSYNF